MRAVLILTLKDLRRALADPVGLLITLAIPLAIAGVMALAFGRRGGEEAGPRLRFLAVDLDKSPISGMITGASQNPEAAQRLEISRAADREEGLRRLRDEEFAALLIIPQGFGEGILRGERVELELIKNPSQSVMPIAAQQGAEVAALYLSAGARILGDQTPQVRRLLDGEGWNDSIALAALFAALYNRVDAARGLLFPPVIEVETRKKQRGAGPFDLMGWMYPGIIVMGLMFTGLAHMKDLLRESQGGTLRRQLAAPLRAGQVLAAKTLSVALIVTLALALLLLIGSMAFGVRWGPAAPLAATGSLLVLAITGFAALIFSIARTDRQGDALGGILTMLMSLLGGAFVPQELLPAWLRQISLSTVNHWGHGALRQLTAGGGWPEVAPYLTALASLSLIFLAAGLTMLHRRHLRGAL